MKPLTVGLVLGLLCAPASAQSALDRAESLIARNQFAEAEQILAPASRSNPEDVEILYRLGYVRYRQRQLATARVSFARAVKLSPPALYSRYFLGQISLMENKPAEAISWLRPVVESKEPVFDAASRLAAAYAQTGDNAKAEQTLKIAIAQEPWDGALYFRLGQLQKKRAQPELAQESFAQSSRLKQASREDVEILMEVSQSLREKQYATAFAAGEAILKRVQADPGALVALGVLYGGADQHERALQTFQLAADRDPRFFTAHLNRGLAYLRLGRVAEASAALEIALSLLPQSSEASLASGLAWSMQRRYGDAAVRLEQAWRSDPANARTGALLATVYLRTNAPAKAVAVLQSPSIQASDDPSFTLLLADAQTANEDLKGALQTARSGRKRFPDVPEAQVAEAQVLVRLGQYTEAQAAFRQALVLRPGWPEAHVGLADCLQKAGEHDPAIEHYQAAKGAPTTALAAHLGLGRSLLALRRFDQAQAILEEAVVSHPSEIAVRVELSRVYARLGRNDLAADQTRVADELRTRLSK